MNKNGTAISMDTCAEFLDDKTYVTLGYLVGDWLS